MPIVEPYGAGILTPASRISSNENSINIISNIIGNGIEDLAAAIANNSSEGINS